MKKRYTPEELEEFRYIITKRVLEEEKELKKLHKQLKKGSQALSKQGAIKLEEVAETHDQEVITELAIRKLRFINNLREAAKRIDQGTYGICRVTGELISKERLRLVPHTTHSVEGKTQRDRS